MLNYFIDVFTQVAILFIMMLVGVVMSKLGKITSTGAKEMTDLLLTVVTVAVIVKAFATVEFSPDKIREMGLAALALVVVTAVGGALSAAAFCKSSDNARPVLRFGSIFSNCGFMGIPVTQAVFGDDGVFVVSIYMAVFQISAWTYGVYIYTRKTRKNKSFKSAELPLDNGSAEPCAAHPSCEKPTVIRKNDYNEGSAKPPLKGIFLNAGVIGVAIGLIIFFLQIKLPDIIMTPISSIAAINTPLAMVVTGQLLCGISLKPCREDIGIIAACALRLLVIPLCSLGILWLLGIKGLPLAACSVPMCAPAATYTVMFAKRYNANGELASRLMSICTLLSIFTMPVVISVARFMAG